MKTDIVIIGAGMAGISAAIELNKAGRDFVILEAQEHIGGRGASLRMPSGVAVDLGAHWLHGANNPLLERVTHYGLAYNKDSTRHMRIYQDGKMREKKNADWLQECIDPEKAKGIESGKLPDGPVSSLAKDAKAKERLALFASMWDGLPPPLEPSALEFLTDESTPGGLQLPGGMAELFARMLADAGPHHLQLNCAVATISCNEDGATVTLQNGDVVEASHVLLTCSLGVLKSGNIRISPPLNESIQQELALISMGKMNKIVIELAPRFFEDNHIPVNFSLQLLDHNPPHFCHVHSEGAPLINLFTSGPAAEKMESLTHEEALAYAKEMLAPVSELASFEYHVTEKPIITQWVTSPYTLGSYSACLPGGKRSGPRKQGRLILCGDTFDTQYPASLAGAHRSGIAAAEMIIES